MTGSFLADFASLRDEPGMVVLEGFHALKHALRFGADIPLVAAVSPAELEELANELAPDLAGAFRRVATEVRPADLRLLVKNPPATKVVALARKPAIDLNAVIRTAAGPVVFLEDPRHLGNVGAVIRTAAAASAAGVITSGAADPWDAAAIRGSAGLHFALPVAQVDGDDVVAGLRSTGRRLIALSPSGVPVRHFSFPANAVFAFGTERHGLTGTVLKGCDHTVSIPMRAGVSSLNLAASVAIVLYTAAGAMP
jgi:RNA methyltransferase, TrmH family